TDLDLACDARSNHALPRASVRTLLPLAQYIQALLCNPKIADGSPPSDDRPGSGSRPSGPATGAGAEGVAEDDGGGAAPSGTADRPCAAIEAGGRAGPKRGGSC